MSVGPGQFRVPEAIRYGCVKCGRSCRMFNEVTVDAESERRLKALDDYRDLLPSEVRHLDPIIPALTSNDRRILRRHEEHCVFQNDVGLCSIHDKFGFAAKPQTCQDFPYRFYETPDGIYVGLSFSCTAVLGNEGPLLTDQRHEFVDSYDVSRKKWEAPRAIRLNHRHEISWAAYASLEEDLAAILAHKGHPLALRLAALSVYIDLWLLLLAEMRGDTNNAKRRARPMDFDGAEAFPPDSGSITDGEIAASLRKRYIQRKDMADLFRLAAKIRNSPTLQRAFLGLITAFRQNLYAEDKKPGRISTVTKIVRHYSAHALKLGRVNLAPLKGRFDYADFRRIRWDVEDKPECRELLDRFFTHALFRKDLLLADSVWLGQRFMLMHYALIRWHATGHAALNARDEITLEDLREALRLVELHYIFHTPFGELFQKFPMLAMALDGIVRKPIYAGAMTGPPV